MNVRADTALPLTSLPPRLVPRTGSVLPDSLTTSAGDQDDR
ncbi:MAG: hypothetical protein QOF58_4059 [Pseudonocardiales bacterium]|jgi:hypothetical protein|nr:hypothetical protein [Pseudonocardiales bacterium]